MKQFMDDNFLLNNDTAEVLYHDYAKGMPIFDYHCHINPQEIAENKQYRNITEVWLGGDHYKWRALRNNGVEEKYVTGPGDDKVKFLKWAETISRCIGNPLYHWTHLELKRYFGIDKVLSPDTAEEIWEKCNEMLKSDEFSARGLIKRSNVKGICTSDDPSDSLEYHGMLAKDASFNVKVLPSLRPDKLIYIERSGFTGYVSKLGESAGINIKSFNDLTEALAGRIRYFHEMGCRISDHSLETVVYAPGNVQDADKAFRKAMEGKALSQEEVDKYKTQLILFLAREYKKHDWTMQLHIGALRNKNTRMMKSYGLDAGCDTIGDIIFIECIANYLDALDSAGQLPRTILYCLNQRDSEAVAALTGSFQEAGTRGKIQFGPAWWYNDNKEGMKRHMITLANISLLGNFVGMNTDSRSFLSYTRHEYFRRVLCNLLGEWAENGEVPYDIPMLGDMVKDICYNNAVRYFKIEL